MSRSCAFGRDRRGHERFQAKVFEDFDEKLRERQPLSCDKSLGLDFVRGGVSASFKRSSSAKPPIFSPFCGSNRHDGADVAVEDASQTETATELSKSPRGTFDPIKENGELLWGGKSLTWRWF